MKRALLFFILAITISSCSGDNVSNIPHNSKKEAVDAVIDSKILDLILDKKVQNSFLDNLVFHEGRIRSIDYNPLIEVLNEKELNQFLDQFSEFMQNTYADYFNDLELGSDNYSYSPPFECVKNSNYVCF